MSKVNKTIPRYPGVQVTYGTTLSFKLIRIIAMSLNYLFFPLVALVPFTVPVYQNCLDAVVPIGKINIKYTSASNKVKGNRLTLTKQGISHITVF